MALRPVLKTIFVHIGTPKTGTTSIQSTASDHYQALLSRDLLYPDSLGERPPHHLLMLASHKFYSEKACRQCKLPFTDDYAAFWATFSAKLNAEIAHTGVSRLLLSSESLSARLFSAKPLGRFAERLHGLAEEVRIICYLRPQHELCLSWYSTGVKNGTKAKFEPPTNADDQFYNYDRMLSGWANQFGAENLTVRVFQRADMLDGDVVRDAFHLMGVDTRELGIAAPTILNTSLDADTIEFLRQLNVHLPSKFRETGDFDSERGDLVGALQAVANGPKLRLSPEQQSRIIELYASSNAAVARRFLGRPDGNLFAPAKDEPFEPAARRDRSFEIMAHLWRWKQSQYLAAKAKKRVVAR